MSRPTVPAAQVRYASPPSEIVKLAFEDRAYWAACRAATSEKSERETRRDLPAPNAGRYCIVPPRAT